MGTAHGSVFLIIAGLLLSMPLLMTTGGAVSLLIDRFKGLVYIGAGVICLTGTRMIFKDAVVEPWIGLHPAVSFAIAAIVGFAFSGAFMAWNRRRPARTGLPLESSRPEGN